MPSDSVRVGDLKVFIIHSSNENDCETNLLYRVEEALKSIGLPSTVITDSDPLPRQVCSPRNIFIMGSFDGPKFAALSKANARIIKPLLLLNALDTPGGIIHNSKFPIHSYSLCGVMASTSGLDAQAKNQIHSRIQMMGGRYSRNFVRGVTHLICANGSTQKYKMAFRLEIPVVLPEWVDAIWDLSSTENIQLDDERLKRYSFGVFRNCVISVTGLSYEDRESIKKLVNDQGGQFSYEFSHKCTHLICLSFKGRKCAMARKCGIPVLSVNWVHDSNRSRYILDNELYLLKPPTNILSNQFVGSQDESGDPLQCSLHGETANANSINDNFFVTQSDMDESTNENSNQMLNITQSLPVYAVSAKIVKQMKSKIHRLNKQLQSVSLFSGLTFYLDGLDVLRDNLSQAITASGGSVTTRLCSAVTHILSGRSNLSVLDGIVQNTYILRHCQVVNLDWFSESIGTQSLINIQDENSYDLRISAMRGTWVEAGDLETPLNFQGKESMFNPLFENRKILLVGFNKVLEDGLSQLIQKSQGHVSTDANSVLRWDVVVCPLLVPSCNAMNANLFITDKWIKACLNKNQLLNPKSCVFYTPICQWNWTSKPLKRCTLTVSGFISSLKEGIFYIGRKLGATMLDNLAKPGNATGSTHLLIKEAKGAKYNAAKTWKIPIVGLSWIVACLLEDRVSNESEHSVGTRDDELNAMVLERLRENRKRIGIVGADDDCIFDPVTFGQEPVSQLSSSACLSLLGPSQRHNTSGNLLDTSSSLLLVEDTNSALDYPPDTTTLLSPSRCALNSFGLDSNESSAGIQIRKSLSAITAATSQSQPITATWSSKAKSRTQVSFSQQNVLNNTSLNDMSAFNNTNSFKFSTPLSDNKYHNNNNNLTGDIGELSTMSLCSKSTTFFDSSFNKKQASVIERMLAQQYNDPLDNSETTIEKLTNLLKDKLSRANASSASGNGDPHKLNSLFGDDTFRSHLSQENNQSKCSSCLEGCVLSASKRLAKYHVDYSRMASAMGAAFLSTYSNNCTHFIFKGRIRETSKEYKIATTENKRIVSPHWLVACYESSKWLDESLFPHCYDPERRLEMDKTTNNKEYTKISGNTTATVVQMFDAENAYFDENTNLDPPTTAATSLSDHGKSNDELIMKELLLSSDMVDESTNLEPPLSASHLLNNETKRSFGSLRCARDGWDMSLSTTGSLNEQLLEHTHHSKSSYSSSSRCSFRLQPQPIHSSLHCHKESSEEICIQWVDEDADLIRAQMTRFRVFCFTGLKSCKNKKSDMEKVVKRLGASVSTDGFTHLITESLTRGERFLTALAKTNCWILKPQYVVDCQMAGHLIDETSYEWAQPEDGDSSELAKKLCKAAVYWRSATTPVFTSWNAVRLICTAGTKRSNTFEQRLQSLQRTLISGGASDVQIVKNTEAIPSIQADCKVFMDDRTISASERRMWIDHCGQSNQNLYKLEYIAALLIDVEMDKSQLQAEYLITSSSTLSYLNNSDTLMDNRTQEGHNCIDESTMAFSESTSSTTRRKRQNSAHYLQQDGNCVSVDDQTVGVGLPPPRLRRKRQ